MINFSCKVSANQNKSILINKISLENLKFIGGMIERIINCITFEESDGILLELNSFILENRLFSFTYYLTYINYFFIVFQFTNIMKN